MAQVSIPKISVPLAKDIRTGEGIFEWATGLALTLAAILPHGLSWTQSGTFLTILAGIKAARRALVKVTALQSSVGVDAPIEVGQGNVIDPAVKDAESVLKEIEAGVKAVETYQAQPGTPEDQVKAAGAPGETPPAAAPAPADQPAPVGA